MADRNSFTDSDYWKAITLYGLNAATYKPALAKTILTLASEGNSSISWEDLADQFLKAYEERLGSSLMPQQGTPGRITKLEKTVAQLNTGKLSRSDAISIIANEGFNDVVPRFHTIGRDTRFAENYFYEADFGKSLRLKDSLMNLATTELDELLQEVDARWSLLEGAFEINHSEIDLKLANDIRETYLSSGYERTTLTNNIPFLAGYQGNVCFYCAEELTEIDVDHVLPRQIIQHDEIWNLVLAHRHCNQLKSDYLVGPHFIEKLIRRNENIMGSNHPWKGKIQSSLGNTPAQRASCLKGHYDKVRLVRGSAYWTGNKGYNPASDPFFRRLITQLNTK